MCSKRELILVFLCMNEGMCVDFTYVPSFTKSATITFKIITTIKRLMIKIYELFVDMCKKNLRNMDNSKRLKFLTKATTYLQQRSYIYFLKYLIYNATIYCYKYK